MPIIHALQLQEEKGSTELLSIFQSGKMNSGMSIDMKKLVLKRLAETGSLEYTKDMLGELHDELTQELSAAEERMGGKNWIFRLILHRLKMRG